jgi:hypothetical protein
MKAKYYIGILSALLLAGMPVKAQYADDVYLNNDDANARIVVNNYYDDYDYYYASRINRFHRSYAVFDYYSPFFTDTYWYTYRPYTWGLSIYRGGLGFSIGYNFNYPLYYGYDYYYDYGWYDPYYYSYNYWGYEPYYYDPYYWCYNPFRYNYWYTPIVFNIGYRDRWNHNYWGWNRWNHNGWGWNRNNHWDRNYAWNDNRSYRNSNNYYNDNGSTRYSSRNNNTFNESRRSSPEGVNRQGTNFSGTRRNPSERPSTSVINNNTTAVRTNINNQSAGRRSVNQPANRSTKVNNQVNRSGNLNQSPARREASAYKRQDRISTAPSRSSNNVNQLSASRRSSASSNYSPSSDRSVSRPLQSRSVSAPSQSRSVSAPSQRRSYSAPAQSRSYSAPAQSRSFSAPSQSRSSQPASHSSSSGSSRSGGNGRRR